ncbi:unnamed protein product, partial [Rotaria sp. Silwood2]
INININQYYWYVILIDVGSAGAKKIGQAFRRFMDFLRLV